MKKSKAWLLPLLIADLRSGPLQGQRRLRRPEGDCCMGRACDVWSKHTGRGFWGPPRIVWGRLSIPFILDGQVYDYAPPKEVSAALGMDSYTGGDYDDVNTYMEDNDRGLTFAEIADCMEQYYNSLED